MRTPLIAANWKMNLLVDEAVETANEMRPLFKDLSDMEVVICPTFVALDAVGKTIATSTIAMGAQNCGFEQSGAYTGEISPQMLLDVGCSWTILGHSERRHQFYETNELVNRKVKFALESELNVIYCIGETLEEREKGQIKAVLKRQVGRGLKDIPKNGPAELVIAYEPVWAIGTGVTATPEQAEEAHAFVRELVAGQFDETVAQEMRILYGGSVKPDNARELLSLENVDGALVGGASLKAESFAAIARAALQEV